MRLHLPVVSGSKYARTIDLAGHLVLAGAEAPKNVAPERPFTVNVTVANLGHGPASARVSARAADCRIDGPNEQTVTVPGHGSRTLAWKLVSGARGRPFIFRAELDGDHGRAIDVTGTIGWQAPAATATPDNR
jgi:hypothetical protein